MVRITGKAKQNAEKALQELKAKWDAIGYGPDFVPTIGSKEDYDKLAQAVQEATRRNESIAQFKERVVDLGKTVASLAIQLGLF